MLFDYVAPAYPTDAQSSTPGTVWSQFPLQPFAPSTLTPFSYSVLAELASRAWFVHYDRLGFDPTPRAKIVRRHQGRVYFNLSLPAQMEADHAGVEPLSLHVNGASQPLATWEKPSFLAGFKLGRAQKKIDDTLTDYARQFADVAEKARGWYLKTQSISRWGQAEVLQIMEEIERVGVESMVAFLAARLRLGQHYGRLAAELAGKASAPQAALLINQALGIVNGLVETEMLATLPTIANALRQPASVAWLQAGQFAEWRTQLPSTEALEGINAFIRAYGHRTAHEGEIALPRWSEDATLLMHALHAYVDAENKAAPAVTEANPQPLLALLPASNRKQIEQSLAKMAELHKLQSHALHALAYIWAGTRSWALAAAREAMVDQRLHSQDEVFLFELEEIKQMMTGEWNISSLDEIRATVATRRAEFATIQQASAPDMLVGDADAFVTHRGLAGVTGEAEGPLVLWDAPTTQVGHDTILATTLLDSGCALALPVGRAFFAAAGSPCDPFVAVAQAWQRPVVVGLGKSFTELADGATTRIHVTADAVKITQAAATHAPDTQVTGTQITGTQITGTQG